MDGLTADDGLWVLFVLGGWFGFGFGLRVLSFCGGLGWLGFVGVLFGCCLCLCLV